MRFDPVQPILYIATLRITTDDPDEATRTVSISGGGIDQEISVGPASIDFGAQPVAAGPTSPQSVTITSLGVNALNVSSITLIGSGAAHFSISSDSGQLTLAKNATRTIQLAFDPATSGPLAATLRIVSDDTDEAIIDVPLSGTGVEPEISVSPPALDFGSIALAAGPSSPLGVTVINNGTSPLHFTGAGFILAGDAAAEFTFAAAPPTSPLDPAASRTVQLLFDPATIGDRSAELLITTDNAGDSTVTVGLAGVGLGSRLSVQHLGADLPSGGGPVSFGTVNRNAPSPVLSFIVSNDGNAPLLTSGLSVPAGYEVGDPLASSIAPGASDTFSIRLLTVAEGTFAGAVSFARDDPAGGPFTFDVTGTVLLALDTTHVWVDFAHAGPEEGSAESPFSTLPAGLAVVQNSGTLHIRAGSAPGPFRIDQPVRLEAVNGPVRLGAGGPQNDASHARNAAAPANAPQSSAADWMLYR